VLLRAAGTGTTRRRPRAAGARRRLLDLLSRASPAGHASHFAAPRSALPCRVCRRDLLCFTQKLLRKDRNKKGKARKNGERRKRSIYSLNP
jgi:hypothetical protein